MDFLGFLQGFFPPLPFGLVYLDGIILLIILFYAWEGYRLGFVYALLDLISFLVSFFLALKFYAGVGQVIVLLFSIPVGFGNALGFFLVALVIEILLSILLRRLFLQIPPLLKDERAQLLFSRADHYLGILPGIISSFIILSFAFSLILSLPSSPAIKRQISSSKIGGKLVSQTSNFEKKLNAVFGGALHDTLTFLTVEPKSNESVALHFTVASPQGDKSAEEQMLTLVNRERVERGLKPVMMDDQLRTLARSYATDMFQRGYFSHYTPEGLSPFDRMDRMDVAYIAAGENLALAPSLEIAMEGLMNSPGHRANILSSEFGHIGIGAMQGGIYGMMFVQEFTD